MLHIVTVSVGQILHAFALKARISHEKNMLLKSGTCY